MSGRSLQLLGRARLDGEAVWLTQRQMVELFDASAENISRYLKNILSKVGLGEVATTEECSVVHTEERRKASKDLMIRLIINLLAEPQA